MEKELVLFSGGPDSAVLLKYFLEQKKNSPQHVPCGMSAMAAVIKAGPELRLNCKKQNIAKLHLAAKSPKTKKISKCYWIVDPMVN